ncbi:hypothetical protein JO41_12270 [Treponema sp. OMZ 838]|nr:hypothetical protein JO41_12270 [Treponema sp. OMZ 838]
MCPQTKVSFFDILTKSFYRSHDKQFGRNSASLFICRVCLSTNVALLYVLFNFVAKARKKLFLQIDIYCKKFLSEIKL